MVVNNILKKLQLVGIAKKWQMVTFYNSFIWTWTCKEHLNNTFYKFMSVTYTLWIESYHRIEYIYFLHLHALLF